jgi:hypothetical protein
VAWGFGKLCHNFREEAAAEAQHLGKLAFLTALVVFMRSMPLLTKHVGRAHGGSTRHHLRCLLVLVTSIRSWVTRGRFEVESFLVREEEKEKFWAVGL